MFIDPLLHKCSFITQTPSPEHPMTEILFVLLDQKAIVFVKLVPVLMISVSEFSHVYRENSNAEGRIERGPYTFPKASLGL